MLLYIFITFSSLTLNTNCFGNMQRTEVKGKNGLLWIFLNLVTDLNAF